MTFRESEHPRSAGGTFVDKPMTAPEASLQDFLLEPEPRAIQPWQQVLVHEVDGTMTPAHVQSVDGLNVRVRIEADGFEDEYLTVDARYVSEDPDADVGLHRRTVAWREAIDAKAAELSRYSDEELSAWEESLRARNSNPLADVNLEALEVANRYARNQLGRLVIAGEFTESAVDDVAYEDMDNHLSRYLDAPHTAAIVLCEAIDASPLDTDDVLAIAHDDLENFVQRTSAAEAEVALTAAEFEGYDSLKLSDAIFELWGEDGMDTYADDEQAFAKGIYDEVFPQGVRHAIERSWGLDYLELLRCRVTQERVVRHFVDEFPDLDPEAFQRAEDAWARVKEHLEAQK